MESVRRIRRERGLSQQELADKAGIGQDSISAIETGKHEPHPRTLRKLANALGVEVADFFREPALAGKAEAPEAGRPKVAASLSLREASAARPEFSELPGLMAARERRGYSRNELAARSGVASSEIAELEEGTREADSDILDRLTAGLSATPGELGFPPETYAAFLEADEADNERIQRALAELSPSELRVLLKHALLKSPGLRKLHEALNEESPEPRSSKRPEAG